MVLIVQWMNLKTKMKLIVQQVKTNIYLSLQMNKKFWTTGELLAMAQDCEKLFERQDVDIHMELYGEGTLVSELWKTKRKKQHPKYENTLSNID